MWKHAMKTVVSLVLALFVGHTQVSALEPQRVDVRNMENWAIVVSKDALESERYAAEEFRDFFALATGYRLLIGDGSTAARHNIFIGASDALKQSELGHVLDATYKPEQLRIVIAAENIAIVGGRPRGVLYGVYQFLEDLLGVRFLSRDFTHVLQFAPTDPLPRRGILAPADYSYDPVLACRFVSFPELQDSTAQFAARLRMNGRYRNDPSVQTEWIKKVGDFNRNGLILHNVNEWLRSSPKDNPDFYAADEKGKRPVSHQPCFSHPEVVRRITQNVLDSLKDFADGAMIPMAQEDTSLCQCDRCQELIRKHEVDPFGNGGENWGTPMFLMVNHVAREAAKVRPDVTIATYAYAPSARPPKNLKMEPSVRIQYATYNADQLHPFGSPASLTNLGYQRDIQEWNRISTGMMYWYYGMGSYTDFFAPPVTLRMAGPHMRTLIESKASSIFVQGDPVVFSELLQYVYARLLWNPRLDSHEVIEEFVDLYYGESAGPVAEFLRLADREVRQAATHPNCNAPDIFAAYGYTEDLGWKGIELFHQALERARTPELKARVEKASLSAYRLSLGKTWLGEKPKDLTEPQRARLRQSARTLFELCARLKIELVHEARRIKDAQAAVRRALDIPLDEPF